MIKVKQTIAALTTSALLLATTVIPAVAAQPWDVTGSYTIGFDCTPSCGGPYVHDANLTQTGTSVTGDGGYPAGGPYQFHWNITSGTVSGDTITLSMTYDTGAPSTVMTMNGTIASNGTMSGTWSDDLNGGRTGTWSTVTGNAKTNVEEPVIISPANGSTVYQAQLTKIDWTDVTGTTGPFVYYYEAYSDTNYTNPVYMSGPLTVSEIPTPGTLPGDYYIRVRAQDSEGTFSDWSNGAGNPYHITVIANPATPTECTGTYTNTIIGTNGSDVLNGTAANDIIFGLGGSDVIDGKGGGDCIVGGDGSDSLTGSGGNDIILGGDQSDNIEGNGGNDTLYGQDGSDALDGGAGNDTLRGGDGADSLLGGADNDSLFGENGSDYLNGQTGIDTADGGANNDACTAETKVSCP
jgi:Ca2+-binding RTX toxin-like protein